VNLWYFKFWLFDLTELIHGLKCLWFSTLGCLDIRTRNWEFVTKTQLLDFFPSKCKTNFFLFAFYLCFPSYYISPMIWLCKDSPKKVNKLFNIICIWFLFQYLLFIISLPIDSEIDKTGQKWGTLHNVC